MDCCRSVGTSTEHPFLIWLTIWNIIMYQVIDYCISLRINLPQKIQHKSPCKPPASNPDRTHLHVQIDFDFTSRSTSVSSPDRLQFYVQIHLNFISRSTSVSPSDRFQFYVQIDFKFTSRSTSILLPDRFQIYVQIRVNFTSKSTSNFTSRSTSILRAYLPEFHIDLNFEP